MFNIPKEYSLIKEYDLKDIDSKGYLLKHVKSGAKISIIENADDNKVFYIAFRTTPTDSTGVAHILEHSVLCGSKKYPLKDPFVELAKGSLNTFLNAMTYPDKTVYPIASQNDKDFANLMDVYIDAVLNPNIYQNEKIFKQEGWHYELDEKGNLIYNGVVYNEMKGAFSSPDDVLEREILNSLFPDNTYAYESGGDPKNIPDLTYEDFLAFHKRYYHPSNSYIYLYGDCDMEERLTYLDREYLAKYEANDPNTEIAIQKPFDSRKNVVKPYPIAEGGDVKSTNYYSLNYVVGDILDAKLYNAFSIIDYALLNSPGAPLREALMKRGIGKDIIGGYSNGTYQPYFTIGVKGATPADKKEFIKVTTSALKEIVENGLDKKALRAAINIQEFQFREADFGAYPKGLVYGLVCLDSWNYDDNEPFLHLDTIKVLDELKKEVETDYFEKLIQKYLINNNHSALVSLRPREGMSKEMEDEVADILSKYKDTLSEDQIEVIDKNCAELKKYQSEPTTFEDLRKLPLLERSDLDRDIKKLKNRLKRVEDIDILYHDINSNGIHYLNMLFDISDMDKEDVCALSLMIRMLGLLDTKEHSYAEYSNEMNILTGGVYASIQSYNSTKDGVKLFCQVGSKFLKEHTSDAIRLSLEMMLDTEFKDSGRMREILNQEIQHFKARMASAGHLTAANRAMAKFSEEGYLSELLSGIEFYNYINEFDKNYSEKIEEFKKKCIELLPKVFRSGGLLISSTGKEDLTKEIESFVPDIKARLYDGKPGEKTDFGLLDSGNEGFKTASAIQYVSRAGNFGRDGFKFDGALRVLKTIMSYEYLWTKIRVQGGAYGCMCLFKRNGDTYFVSYRDPNLAETNKVFEEAPDYIKQFDCDDRDMTKYVIGTVSSLDTPLTPSQEGERSLNCYLSDYAEDELQKFRDDVLDAGVEDIRALAGYIESVMNQNNLCVLGNENAIEDTKDLFDKVVTLV